MSLKKIKRIFGLLLAAVFLISLTGCQPSHFTTQENHDMTDAVTGDVNDWFQKNYPTAMDISYNLQTEYVDTDGDVDIYGYVLTDLMEGQFVVDGTRYEYAYIDSSKTMYLSTYANDAQKYAKKLYYTGLGFSEDDILADGDVNIYINPDIKGYYDLDSKGKLNEMDISLANYWYTIENVLPSDLKETEVEKYVYTGLKNGNLECGSYSITVNKSMNIKDINLKFLREYQHFNSIEIETPDVKYEMFTDYQSINNQDKKVLCIKTVGDAENATYSDASPGEASPSSAGKTEDDKKHIYVYDMETLGLLRDYDLEEE